MHDYLSLTNELYYHRQTIWENENGAKLFFWSPFNCHKISKWMSTKNVHTHNFHRIRLSLHSFLFFCLLFFRVGQQNHYVRITRMATTAKNVNFIRWMIDNNFNFFVGLDEIFNFSKYSSARGFSTKKKPSKMTISDKLAYFPQWQKIVMPKLEWKWY